MPRIPLDRRQARESFGSGRVHFLTSIDRRLIRERWERRIAAFAAFAVLFAVAFIFVVLL